LVAITRGMDVRDVSVGVPPRAAAVQPPPARPQSSPPQGLTPQHLAFAGLAAGADATSPGRPRLAVGPGR